MKNLKKISAILLFLIITSVGVFISCSKETDEVKQTNSNQLRIVAGTEIGELRTGNVFVITADESDLLAEFDALGRAEGFSYTMTGIEIVEVVDEVDSHRTHYLLYAHDRDYEAKAACFLELVNGKFMAMSGPTVTCTSTNCQFGCAPGAVYNPSTGHSVLTCTTCANPCTKTATATLR